MKSIVKRILVASAPFALAIAVACTGPAEGSNPPTISPDVFAPIPTPRPFGQTPTPTATPFLLPVPTVGISETVAPTATPSATMGAPGPAPTTEATVTSVPLPTATPTSVPIVIPTATPTVQVTTTPEPTQQPTATPEPTASPTPTPNPAAPGGIVFSLEEGAISLDLDQWRPESVAAGVDVTNFSARAEFGNPVNATFRPYSYGIKFRETATEYYAVTINSAGEVSYIRGVPGADNETDFFNVLSAFEVEDLAEGGSESNTLELTVIDDLGWLYVNGQYVSQFNVAGVGVAADIEFIAELQNETNVSGAFTELLGAEVRESAVAKFVSQGSLLKETGEPARTEPTAPIRDSIVEAEFIAPYERVIGKWSVGFEYYDPISLTTNWLIVNNSQEWKHLRQVGVFGPIEEIVGGRFTGILRNRGDVNTIKMIGKNGNFQIFINGQLMSGTEFGQDALPAQISAIAGFNPDDKQTGVPTKFTNFVVWSFGI